LPPERWPVGRMDAYEITCDRARLDVGAIHGFLSRSYWSPDIPRAVVERAIANSLCFGRSGRHHGDSQSDRVQRWRQEWRRSHLISV
jgi:hypothetical protein